ncbi:MAG: GNAT family N-acetyltransferase [Alphaproteobacteria bacterium]
METASDILIRPATPGDGAAMSGYVSRLVAENLDTILLNHEISPDQEEETIRHYQETEHHVFLLALDGGQVVGMLDIHGHEHPAKRHWGVFGMSVDAGYRGRGVGRRLLERAIAEARSWPGFCRLELGVTPWNERAIELYRSLGFVLEGVKRKGINLRGEPEDDLIMALVW